MAGDDPEADIAGGASAGVKTVWVSHNRPWPSSAGLVPDLQSSTPAGALALLLEQRM